MRTLLSVVLAVCVSVSVFAARQARTAEAAFHCMRIHAVMGGYNGDNNIQFVELRMDAAFQSVLGGHKIQFFDGVGVLKATFTFPTGVISATTGDSVLIATSEFNTNVTGGAADFTFSAANTTGASGGDPLHPVQLTGGSIVFAPGGFAPPDFSCFGGGAPPADVLAYGGAPATFGTPAAALPTSGTYLALRLSNLAMIPTNNSTEYALLNVSTTTFTASNLTGDFSTPRNNGRNVLRLNPPFVPGVGGIAEQPAAGVASVASGRDRWTGSGVYAIAGGIALAAIAAGAGFYAYRRRMA